MILATIVISTPPLFMPHREAIDDAFHALVQVQVLNGVIDDAFHVTSDDADHPVIEPPFD